MMRFLILVLFLLASDTAKVEEIFTNQFEYLVSTRVNALNLRDPHTYFLILDVICQDITDSINAEFNSQISTDNDSDGFLDLSFVTQYYSDQPAYLASKTLTADIQNADCSAPQAGTSCSPVIEPILGQLSTIPQENGTCLAPLAGTTTGYIPSVNSTDSPCHSTLPQNITLNLAGIELPLENYQQSLRYQNGITTDQGLHMGFISESVAESVIIPPAIPVIGGQTFASLLPGGFGSCAANDDRDIGPDGQTLGWWIYFNSESDLVEFF